MANRKRSSRIDAKLARQKEEEERAERECKLQEEHRAAREAAERSERIGRVSAPVQLSDSMISAHSRSNC